MKSLSRNKIVSGSSERSFGMVMTVAFAVMSLLSWWRDGHSWGWTGAIALFFLAATLLYPAVLMPLNRIWLKFGLLLQMIVTQIVMAFVFFGTALPIGLVMRALGKDPLRLKRQPGANTYWIDRRPPGPAPKSMRDQF
jgi:hypothetical protein